MNVIQEKLINTHRFTMINQSIFSDKDKYVTNKISMVVSGFSDYDYSGFDTRDKSERLIEHIYGHYVNTLYKYIVDNIGKIFKESVIEKVLELPRPYNEYPQFDKDYYEPSLQYNASRGIHPVNMRYGRSSTYDRNIAYNDDDGYIIIDHAPIVIWSFDINEMSGYMPISPHDPMYYGNTSHKAYEITCELSIPDNIKIYNILSDKDEIKIFKRQKAIEKLTNNINNQKRK